MNTEATVVSPTSDKPKQSDENVDEEPAQKMFKACSVEDINRIECLHNTILDVKSRLIAVYQETGSKLKNSFESIELIVPELKKDLSLPPLLISPELEQKEQPTQQKLPNITKQPPIETKQPPTETKQPPKKTKQQPKKTSEPTTTPKPKKTSITSITDCIVGKWTLLHHKLEPGLIELMPGAGIYVSEEALNECKLKSTDMKQFARALLPKVFSPKAFLYCSFTGPSPGGKPPKIPGKPRPGFDKYAKDVFLEYVTKHAEESGWDHVFSFHMNPALSDKVASMRYRLFPPHIRNPKLKKPKRKTKKDLFL